jgi:alpha-tubulin suppressor-like RCC1 family protein
MSARVLPVTATLGGLIAIALAAGMPSGAAARTAGRSLASIRGSAVSASVTAASTPSPNAAVGVSGGTGHACAVLARGAIACWGSDTHAELGDANTDYGLGLPPVLAVGITNATSVSAGGFNTCAVLSTGGVECWGYNASGQLGNRTLVDSVTPVAVAGLANAASVSTSGANIGHSCALLRSGAIECWGDNEWGELGDGAKTTSPTPVRVSGIDDAVAVSAGLYGTCAVLAGGGVECWGANFYGQLGNGTNVSSATPVAVRGITNAVSVSVGDLQACSVLSDGSVECWGANYYGELGDGTKTDRSAPVSVSGIEDAVSVSAGRFHTCAVLASGRVKCWGYGLSGRLGNGQYGWDAISPTPVEVNGITDAVAVSSGDTYTCAILSDGSVEYWGAKLYDQLTGFIFNLTPAVVVIPTG